MSCIEFTAEDLTRAADRHVASLPTYHKATQKLTLEIAEKHGVTVAEMLSASRASHLVEARRDLAFALRARSWSYPRIGKLMKRDHTTVMALLKP